MDTAKPKGSCAVNGCERPVRSRGLCATHYRHYRAHEAPTKCSVADCERPLIAGGLCPMHYQRFRAHGSTDKPERKRVPIPHGTIQGYNFHRCRCERCATARREYAAGYRNAHLDDLHHLYLLQTYGITQEQYEEILEQQDGVCAICRQVRLDRRRKHLDVDHDHGTGRIRGILCNKCNRLVGTVEVKLREWRPIIDYLKAAR